MTLAVPDVPSADLSQALASWRDWGLGLESQPSVVGPVPGGRTNRSYRVHAPELEADLVLRLNTRHARRLGIHRAHELVILNAVADAGLAPRPLYWDPQLRFTLLPCLDARTWNARDLADPRQRRRVGELVERARQLQPDTPVRSYRDYLNHYWRQLEVAGAVSESLRREWLAFEPRLRAFDQSPDWRPVLTHHDLIPENILEAGDRLYLIDWEYAALGHPEIDDWCLEPDRVGEPFIHDLARWTNDLWERVVTLLS